MTEYQEDIRDALRRMYGLDFTYLETVWVSTKYRDFCWDGEVEVFAVHGDAEAVWAYAWADDEEGEDGLGIRYMAVLAVPSIDSPEEAVRIAYDTK